MGIAAGVGKSYFSSGSRCQNTNLEGIDKLTRRRGLALTDRGINALYVDARSHWALILTSKDAGHSHIPITELVNLSIPSLSLYYAGVQKDESECVV